MEELKAEFYNPSGALGYDAFITMSNGARGIGKSFSWLNIMANDFLRTGNKFAWVRRYETEIYGDPKKGTKGCADGFGDNVSEVYKKKKFSVDGNAILLNGKKCGEFISLSTTVSQKGFMRKKDDLLPNLVFDEYLIDNPSYHYIGGNAEPTILANLYHSIARPDGIRGTGDNGRMVLLANATTFANPYFLYFNVLPFKGRYYYDKGRDLLVEMCENTAFADKMRQTRFGRAFDNTPYASYAFDNEMLFDDDKFIEPKKTAESSLPIRDHLQKAKNRVLVV